MKSYFYILVLLITVLAVNSCSSHRSLSEQSLTEIAPAGTKIFNKNFYVDEIELTNLSWREYLFWLAQNHGNMSKVYLTALPDTNVWLSLDTCLWTYAELYLRHPAYSDYPVVGISQSQAKEYSKWRSDRVMEYLLVKDGRIIYQNKRDVDNLFTIERYFSGSLDYITEEEKLGYYPVYRLPKISERKEILYRQDSLERSSYKPKKNYRKQWETYYLAQLIGDVPTCKRLTIDPPLKSVFWGSYLGGYYNLQGNVSEFVEEDSISVGGSWHDSRTRILASDTFHVDAPNAWTGFRNVCEWKKWE